MSSIDPHKKNNHATSNNLPFSLVSGSGDLIVALAKIIPVTSRRINKLIFLRLF